MMVLMRAYYAVCQIKEPLPWKTTLVRDQHINGNLILSTKNEASQLLGENSKVMKRKAQVMAAGRRPGAAWRA